MISVLYADEEAGLLDLAKIYLERHGDLRIDPVPSGVHALAALQRQPYDVVVSDYLMPGMNGIDLLKALRGQGIPVPFILFTGRGREEVVIEALNNGVSFYLQKGGDPKAQFAELRHMILQSVQKREVESSLLATQYSVDHASDEIFWSDADGRFKYVNEAACRSLGYTRDELLALSIFDIDTVCTKEVWKFLIAQIRAGNMAPVRSSHRRKDGTTFPVEISCSYVKLDDKEYIFAYSRDITAREQAEEALRESEEKYRYLVEVNRDIVFTMDTTGTICYVSAQVIPQLGYQKDEVIGRQFTDFLHPDDARFLSQHVRDHFVSMVDIPGDQFRLRRKDGSYRWYEDKSIYVTDLHGDRIMIGALRDITDRRMAEEALRENEERYRAVVESQTEMISRFTPERIHTFVNEAYCRNFGLKREEVIGQRFVPDLPADDRRTVRDHLAALSREQPVGRIVHQVVLPGGIVRWQRWIDQAIYDDNGQLVEYQSVGRDITEERENEELARASTQRLADIVNFLPDATFVIDRDKKVIAWNHAVERMTGVESSTIIGQGNYAYAVPFYGIRRPVLIDLIDEDDAATESQYRYVKRDGDALYAEVFVPSLFNGRGAYVWVKASPLYDQKGVVTGAIETIRDISEQREAQEALVESEDLFRTLVDSMLDATLILDWDGTILFANLASARLVGVESRDEGIGRNVIEFVSTASRDAVVRDLALVREATDGFLAEYEIVAVDGRRKWVEALGKRIRFKGTFADLISLREITERRTAEEALRTSEEKFRALFHNANDAILLNEIGPDGLPARFIEVNDLACARMGMSRSEFLALPADGFGLTEYIRHNRRLLSDLHAGRPVTFEFSATTRGGVPIPFEVSSHIFTLANKPVLISIARDITDRMLNQEVEKKAFEQIEKNISQLAILGDQIRNPLAVIIACADMDHSEHSQKIIEQAKIIDDLITNLDKGWIESEKVRDFVRRHYGLG